MKVIILAGGYGTRLESITETLPKPMVPIGGMPILWHIMKSYSHFGFNDFVLPLGYKGNVVKDFFYHYQVVSCDLTVDLGSNKVQFHNNNNENQWKVTMVDTGLDAEKGARIKKIAKYLDDDVNMLTYGDGLADIDVAALVRFHKAHGKIVTLTGVYPPSHFGEIQENDGVVGSFLEKPQVSRGMINGGFMVFNRQLLDYLEDDDSCDLEMGPLQALVQEEEVMVYKHFGSWMCMDSKRELELLNHLWKENNAFWKVWD